MNRALTKKLEEFGLSEKEARIYTCLLEIGASAVHKISKHTGINRSSSYVVLESLRKKGLVGISEDAKVRRYVATSPEILLHSAETLAKKQENIKNTIKSILPDLKALHRKKGKQVPVIRVFEGIEGIIAAHEESLNNKEKLIRVCSSWGHLVAQDKTFEKYLENYVKRRVKQGIRMYGIHPYSDNMVAKSHTLHPKSDKHLFISKDKYPFSTEMAIYDNKTCYISPQAGWSAIIIESKELTELMKNVFDMAWKEAKRISLKK